MKKILVLLIFTLFVCVSLFAQNKIAVVDTDAFYDEKSGIQELIVGNKKLEAEFKDKDEELKLLNEKIKKIIDEVENSQHNYRLPVSETKKKVEEKYLEAQSLSNTMKSIIAEVRPRFEKRKVEIIEPINKRIAEKLKKFAKQKSYETIIEDLNKQGCVCESGVCISYVDYPNVTNEFINFCNEEFEKEKAKK